MPTLPRLCLVDFADYKQKDWVVNAICRLVSHEYLLHLSRADNIFHIILHLIVPEAYKVIAFRTFGGIA